MRDAFRRRRDLVYRLASDIPGLRVNRPMGAFYLFPECKAFFGKHAADGRTIETASDLAMYLRETAHVACVGGAALGAPECIRLSYATCDDTLVEAVARIKKALAELS